MGTPHGPSLSTSNPPFHKLRSISAATFRQEEATFIRGGDAMNRPPSFPQVGQIHEDGPFTFDTAPSPRHKAWSAGFDPAYWYPVAWSHEVAKEKVREVIFQGMSVAVFRGADGNLGALENRCAHRQVKLSLGEVRDCALQCSYHGWTFGADGQLQRVGHEHFGGKMPRAKLKTFPIQERYGLIWVFFGDPALTGHRPLPRIENLEGDRPWSCVPISFDLRCHPTAIVNNVMDSTHVATLHRTFRTRTLNYGPVTRCETVGDAVHLEHDIELDSGGLLRWLVNPLKVPKQHSEYRYPYLIVTVGEVYQLWNLFLPIGPRRCRLFLLPMSEGLRVPGTTWSPPNGLVAPFLSVARRYLVEPLFTEDVWSFEAEQQGYDAHYSKPAIDPHPAIAPSYRLTVRKWEEYLARQR